MRAWQLSDMAGVTGTEYLDSTAVDGLAAVAEGVTPVTLWTAKRPGGGTATAARAFRDDFRPYLGTVNGKQSVYFDTATRQLNLDTAGLPAGRRGRLLPVRLWRRVRHRRHLEDASGAGAL